MSSKRLIAKALEDSNELRPGDLDLIVEWRNCVYHWRELSTAPELFLALLMEDLVYLDWSARQEKASIITWFYELQYMPLRIKPMCPFGQAHSGPPLELLRT